MVYTITIDVEFQIEQIVFLVHDVEQRPRMIHSINIGKNNVIMYEVISGTEVSTHYEFELSEEKTIY